jgi:hypothetical protein
VTTPLPDGAQVIREQLLELLQAQALTGARLEETLGVSTELDLDRAVRGLPVARRHWMEIELGDTPETLRFVGTASQVTEMLRAAAGLGGAG